METLKLKLAHKLYKPLGMDRYKMYMQYRTAAIESLELHLKGRKDMTIQEKDMRDLISSNKLTMNELKCIIALHGKYKPEHICNIFV